MHPRKKIMFVVVILIGLAIGYLIKNVKEGFVIGLFLGLLGSGLLRASK